MTLRAVSGSGGVGDFSRILVAQTSSDSTAGNNNVNATLVTTAPTATSAKVTTAVLGQITHTGPETFDSVGHNIPVFGYWILDANVIVPLGIANEGKCRLDQGTVTNLSSFTAAISDCASGTAVTNYVGFRSGGSSNTGAVFTNFSDFRADDILTGTITNRLCFNAQNITNASAAVSFYAQQAAGSNKYCFYAVGTAQNQFNGVTGIGIAPSSTAALTLLAGTTAIAPLRITPGVAPTSPTNGDFWLTASTVQVRLGGVTKTFTLT